MAQSKAHADRENVTESLRRHGFDESGIAAMFAAEAFIESGKRAKRAAKPVEQISLDFGDWLE